MSKWRDKYKVHPAADVFPMMSDAELRDLGDDIKRNGLKHPIIFQHADGNDAEALLLDGRNRLEAMERAGVECWIDKQYRGGDPVAHIIGLNIHRRHLTKLVQAELIVAACKAAEGYLANRGEVSKGGRGKVDQAKAKAVEAARALKNPIGKRTVERAFAKAEGKTPKPQAKPTTKTKVPIIVTMPAGIEHARKHYVREFVELKHDERRAEWKRLYDALQKAVEGEA
jgi:hypothetical protein